MGVMVSPITISWTVFTDLIGKKSKETPKHHIIDPSWGEYIVDRWIPLIGISNGITHIIIEIHIILLRATVITHFDAKRAKRER